MTDSMNFGPDWIRNLSSEGTTTGSSGGGPRYQLADYRYGREEMLALFDKTLKPPISLVNFKKLYSETTLLPLALTPNTEEEQKVFQRPTSLVGPSRSRGGLLERGGRVNRGGRGSYPTYRTLTNYEIAMYWNQNETTEWSPRKDTYAREGGPGRGMSDNWRRNRGISDEEEGWRNLNHLRSGSAPDKWGRSMSWRGGDGETEDRQLPPERIRGWNDRGSNSRRNWETEDRLPEWATENPMDGGGTFDSSGAFHNSDDEQLDSRTNRKDSIQKSSSQHNMAEKRLFNSLQTSKSAVNVQKPDVGGGKLVDGNSDNGTNIRFELSDSKENQKDKQSDVPKEKSVGMSTKVEPPEKNISNGQITDQVESSNGKAEEDFKIQEVILKLVDEDTPKPKLSSASTTTESPQVQPPPNLAPPPMTQDQWFYEDPQGQMQGPFSSTEMADWFKAGYFLNELKVRRPCDEIFYMLGDLIALCDGQNPFLSSSVRFPPLKGEPPAAAKPDPQLLQYQYLMALREAQARSGLGEPWSSLNLSAPPAEIAAQRLMMHSQIPQDLPFINQSNSSNSLMHLLSQMQANKMATPNIPSDKAPPNIPPNSLDPLIQLQLNNLHQMQNRAPPAIPNNPMASRLAAGLPTEGRGMPAMLSNHPLSLCTGVTPNISNPLNIPRPAQQGIENLVPKPENDPLSNLLKQLQQQKQQHNLESLWQQNQYSVPSTLQNSQWQPNQTPMSLWDIAQDIPSTLPEPVTSSTDLQKQEKSKTEPVNKEKKEEAQLAKEAKKKKDEEKQLKKEAEEKRKQEQKKQEAERKAAEEKKKKEEEKIRKELEKAKKEAEEKRLRELEEKRRLKEQRKAEEEAKKKVEEQKKLEEEQLKKEAKEREEQVKKEAIRQAQEQAIKNAKAAPWSQAGSMQGLSLSEIQKLEKERKVQELMMQQKQMQELQLLQQQTQQNQEKSGSMHLSWAKKPVETRKVQSLAEIQAEEQEKLAKHQAEARLLALQKEKEVPPVQNVGNIWNSQSLSWSSSTASSNAQSQWITNSTGLWEETSMVKPTVNKPSQPNKPTPSATTQPNKTVQQPVLKPKNKKKEELSKNSSTDEFTTWCFKTLSTITSEVDIPTFVTFLRDIESAFDIREYCKEYLGDNSQTHQFASQFLEKRRQFRPKNQVPKDDMCSPAPAITPSLHSSDFQEVKGKNKKNKKNKMLKVDSRILGFNVTSAPDRINVGDRDYGDNS